MQKIDLNRPNYYAGNWVTSYTFLATYRGKAIFTLEYRPMGKTIRIDTHGFHTITTAKALTYAFYDAGFIHWYAKVVNKKVEVHTDTQVHKLGDIVYIIMI